MLSWLRFALVGLLLAAGLCVAATSILGIFRFRFALNRMQAASILDTLAMMLVLLSMAVAYGPSWATAKIVLIIFFMWVAGPVSSHLISKLEAVTDPRLSEHMDIRELDEVEGKERER